MNALACQNAGSFGSSAGKVSKGSKSRVAVTPCSASAPYRFAMASMIARWPRVATRRSAVSAAARALPGTPSACGIRPTAAASGKARSHSAASAFDFLSRPNALVRRRIQQRLLVVFFVLHVFHVFLELLGHRRAAKQSHCDSRRIMSR